MNNKTKNKITALGVIMDSIATITYKKDSTLAMLLAAQQRAWKLFYMEQSDIFLRDGQVYARMRALQVMDNASSWYEYGETTEQPLATLDVLLMRKDPPFNMEYIYTTYLLEHAQQQGVLVVNHPRSLRDANEKLFTTWFPQCCPPTLVTREAARLIDFLQQYQEVIFKPLEAMGGKSVFRVRTGDANVHVIIDYLTHQETSFIMAQQYIPEITTTGDKRILMIDGKPIPYALARIPAAGDFRGNLAAGAKGVGVPLTDRDYWLCEQIGPTLKQKGLLFVGIDVIGDYLTEINVTSPTCIREIDACFGTHIADELLDVIQGYLAKKN